MVASANPLGNWPDAFERLQPQAKLTDLRRCTTSQHSSCLQFRQCAEVGLTLCENALPQSPGLKRKLLLIGVIIPAHNEEKLLGACLDSVVRAGRHPRLNSEAVLIVVALDDCSDGTQAVAHGKNVMTISVHDRNVGTARAAGARLALENRCRWLAFTDADTIVADHWLASQLELAVDAVCGTIAVGHWDSYGEGVRQQHHDTYQDRDGHRHVHGANLGVSAEAYRLAGGFADLKSSEDVALINALSASGAQIAWSAAPRVWTSARRTFRAPNGFGAALAAAEKTIHGLDRPVAE